MTSETQQQPAQLKAISPWKVVGLIILTVVLSVAITLFVVYSAIFPSDFRPVTLNQQEEQVLQQKLQRLDPTARATPGEQPALTPEPYTEEGASR
ncbi:MAG TPA: arginine N-succinyltransferase, partial [Gammaproteobacteria bacterium]